ncbi:MAG: glycosyltransferase [Crocinitomicaceae bacterium]|nr:glycosyltransferase [Crocinitomicaceae bacterium]
MKVSIITVAFNSASTIEDTIRSVVSQDYPSIEYIIIDGASTDETLPIIEKYREKITTVVSERDDGIYDAMNKGIQCATGDIVGILNSDDFYADQKVISDMVALFKTSGCDAAYADLVYIDRINLEKVRRIWKSGVYKTGQFLHGWMPPHPTFFVKKSIYDRLGTYSTTLRSAADYELMLRFVHKHHISIAYLPRVITKMRSGGQSNVSLRNRLKANREDRLAWAMNGLNPHFFTLIMKPLSKVFQFLR